MKSIIIQHTYRTHSINSKAAFFILKAGAKHVNEGGKMLSIGTALLAAFTGSYTSYAGSKAPLEHFTRGLAKELLGRSISVNCVAPGPMDTRKLCSYLCSRTPLIYFLSFLLPTRERALHRLPQERCDWRKTDRGWRYRSIHKILGYRRWLDQWADSLCQWWFLDSLIRGGAN